MSGVAPPKKANVGPSKKRTLENNGTNPMKRQATEALGNIPVNKKIISAPFGSRFTVPSKNAMGQNIMGTTRSNTGTMYPPSFGKGGRRRRATRKRRVSRKRMTRRR